MSSNIETVSGSEYTNKLHEIEAQIKQTEVIFNGSLKDSWCNGEVCCAKICISFITTSLLSIFAICDVYYGTTDITCVSQSQETHHLNITLKSYLLASGIIVFSFIVLLNIGIFLLDIRPFPQKENNDTDALIFWTTLCKWLLNGFGFSWLILGSVLFWAYTDITECSQPVHDYLFARFIIGIVMTAGSICYRGKD